MIMGFRGFDKKCSQGILILIALLLAPMIFSPTASAAGIRPSTVEVNFIPGLQTSYSFNIDGYADDFWFEVQCPDYISINNESIVQTEDRVTFNVDIHLPPKIDRAPGVYRCVFVVHHGKNDPNVPKGGGVSAITEIGGTFIFYVPAEGKYAEITLDVPNVNQGEPLFLRVGIDNKGNHDLLDLVVGIEIMDINNKTIERVQTTSGFAPIFSSTEVWKKLDTSSYDTGRYTARAVLDYGGEKPAVAEKAFMLGGLFVNFLNITLNGYAGKIIPVAVEVENGWGNVIENTYAEVRLYNASNASAGTFRTISADLEPWKSAVLTSYWDTTLLAPGIYTAVITINYRGGKSEATRTVFLAEEPKPLTASEMAFIKLKEIASKPIVILIAIIALIMVNAVLWAYKRKRKHCICLAL